MSISLKLITLLVLILVSIMSMSIAAIPAQAWIPPDSHYNEGPVIPAMTWLMRGPQAYFAVNEKWPETWQDVVDSGLITQPLYEWEGQIVNPDDRSWDFNGDKQYMFQGDDPPLIMSWTSFTNTTDSLPVIVSMPTWEDIAGAPAAGESASFPDLVGNKERQLQLSVVALINDGVSLFEQAYGRVPETYAELAESGMGPLAPGTLNSLTGEPWGGTGAPNDFMFECEAVEGGVYMGCYATDADGEPFHKGLRL